MNQPIELHDIQDPAFTIFTRLSEKQLLHYYEPDLGLFLAESPNVILRALQAGYEPVSLLTERKYLADCSSEAEIIHACRNIPIYTADASVLTQLKGFSLTRGMLCVMRRKPSPPVQSICDKAKRIVVLENVMNPTNVGAIFRSAAALNIDAVLLTHGCSDPLQRRSIRVSVGNVFLLPWTYLPQTDGSWLLSLKSEGYTTIAMALCEDSVSLSDPRLKQAEKLAIIMGTEGEGLCLSTIEACDYTVKIPMSHGVDSLNVAAASAVAFWELTR